MKKNDLGTLHPSLATGAERSLWRWLCVALMIISGWIPTPVNADLSEDFQGVLGDWQAEGGMWVICAVQGWPDASCNGTELCAKTVCNGSYASNTSSRLISPICVVPTAGAGGQVALRFCQAFSYNSGDRGDVQVRVRTGPTWGPWTTVATPATGTGCLLVWTDWTPVSIDLSAYAGQTIQFAFFHQATDTGCGGPDVGPGWYVDSVELVPVNPPYRYSPSFEQGWGDWTAEYAVWDLCPVVGWPGSPGDGTPTCAQTACNGNYPSDTSGRLISPPWVVPMPALGGHVDLQFWQAYSYNSGDSGTVQVRPRDASVWTTLATPAVGTGCFARGSVWSRVALDLTAFAGQTIQVAFLHQAGDTGCGGPDVELGWYVDSVAIVAVNPPFDYARGFERHGQDAGWGGWFSDAGVWQIVQDAGAHSGSNNATVGFPGEYPPNTSSRLISPSTIVRTPWPDASNLPVELHFWMKYSYNSGDGPSVQIQTWNGAVWSDWTTLQWTLGVIPGCSIQSSNGWFAANVEIPATYHGQLARFGFFHQATDTGCGGPDVSTGWVLDDVQLNYIGDFNGRGGVTIQDLFDYLSAWFARHPRADINGNGEVTLQDLFDFLAAWFAERE